MSAGSLETILHHVHGFWSSAIFATGVRFGVFAHLAHGPLTANEFAARVGISVRGSQSLLDGLLALKLIEGSADGYTNAPEATAHLVPGSKEYLGGYADMVLATIADWAKFPDAVTTGRPLHRQERADPENLFWKNLVRALAPLGHTPATAAAQHLRIGERSGFEMLDVGGGLGVYSAVWLSSNPRGRCVQLDWPNVNSLAREYMREFGYENRFGTIDGDMEKVEIAPESYDYVIYSNMASGLSEQRNIAVLRRIKTWLKPGGTLLVSSLMPENDRTAHAFVLMSSANLLLNTEEGTVYTQARYEAWLLESGFVELRSQRTDGIPFTLIYAA